jgi:hypothetical protein
VLAKYTDLADAANTTKDALQFKDADLDEQVESWQASQSMVVVMSMVALGATAFHILVLLGWWLLRAVRPDRHVPQALLFPVAEHTLAGVVAQPLALGAVVVLLQPCALPGVRVLAAASMVGLLVYIAAIFLVLLAVATRRHELGLQYTHAQNRCVPWLLCRNGLRLLHQCFQPAHAYQSCPPRRRLFLNGCVREHCLHYIALQAGCASCQARCSSCRARCSSCRARCSSPTSLGAECRSS